MARSYERESGTRQSSLIVVAVEGEKTEPKYFDALVQRIHNSRYRLLHKNKSGESCPLTVATQLQTFKEDNSVTYEDDDGNEITVEDSYWAVVDTDGPHIEKLEAAAALCEANKFSLAVSNPCFELWLLLHFVDVAELPASEQENLKTSGKKYYVQKIDTALGPNNSSILDIDYYLPLLSEAISRARKLDVQKDEPWPPDLGTRVYLLLEELQKS